MHTAICTFEDPAAAQRAVDRMLQAGFDRRDVHLEHRHRDGTPMEKENDAWDGLEREIAVDRSVLERLGAFFGDLFGKDKPHPHHDTYSKAVDRGLAVVVVDAHDEADAMRAQSLMHDMNAADLNVVHRAEQRPLRDIIGSRAGVTMEEAPTVAFVREEMIVGIVPSRQEREEDRALAKEREESRDKPAR